jgi:hypothetical protein
MIAVDNPLKVDLFGPDYLDPVISLRARCRTLVQFPNVVVIQVRYQGMSACSTILCQKNMGKAAQVPGSQAEVI